MELRRGIVIALLMLWLSGAARAAIRAYPLDDRTVYTIRLSRDVPTTCLFPGPLTALEGANVSGRVEDTPAVLLSHQAGAEYFSLRALGDAVGGALNVVFRGRVYVLSLVVEGDADRSVSFLDEPLTGGGRAKSRPDVAVLRALLERAKHHARLAEKFPALDSAIERSEPGTVTHYRGFSATIAEVFRFEAEDVLVFHVRLQNQGGAAIAYDRDVLAVRVGADLHVAALADASGSIPANATTHVYFAVTGGLHGGRANLSVRDAFSLIVPHP